MNLYGLVKALHILAVTAAFAGVVGGALIRSRLLRLDDIHIMHEFVDLEGRFDQWLVVYGSMTVLLRELLLTWLGHWPLFNAGIPTWILVGAMLFLSTIPSSSGSTFLVVRSLARLFRMHSDRSASRLSCTKPNPIK